MIWHTVRIEPLTRSLHPTMLAIISQTHSYTIFYPYLIAGLDKNRKKGCRRQNYVVLAFVFLITIALILVLTITLAKRGERRILFLGSSAFLPFWCTRSISKSLVDILSGFLSIFKIIHFKFFL